MRAVPSLLQGRGESELIIISCNGGIKLKSTAWLTLTPLYSCQSFCLSHLMLTRTHEEGRCHDVMKCAEFCSWLCHNLSNWDLFS